MDKIQRIKDEVIDWKKPMPKFPKLTVSMTAEQYDYFCRGAVAMSKSYVKRLKRIIKK